MKMIAYTTSARRQFRRLPRQVQERIKDKLSRYAETGAGDVTAMTG